MLDGSIQEGIYAHFSGPYYETKAEIRATKIMGVDPVEMSTVPETITANHTGLKVLVFAVVTNIGYRHTESQIQLLQGRRYGQ